MPTTTTTIRTATDADLEAIRAIYNESIPKRIATADLEPQTLDARRAWFVNRNHATRPVLVAVEAQGVCAWGSFTNFKDRSAYAPTAEISVYVADRAAGRGVGRAEEDEARVMAVAAVAAAEEAVEEALLMQQQLLDAVEAEQGSQW